MPVELIGGDNWNATITAPGGGDPRNSASVRTLGQRLADNVQYLKNRIGAIANVVVAQKDPGLAVAPGNLFMTSTQSSFNGAAWANVGTHLGTESITVSNLRAGDGVLVYAHLLASLTAPNIKGYIRIGDATLNEAIPGAYTMVIGQMMPYTLVGHYVAPAAVASKTFYLMGYVDASVPGSIAFWPISMSALVLQP